jgi:hypothetical protein
MSKNATSAASNQPNAQKLSNKTIKRPLSCIIHERMAKAFCGGTRLPKMLMAP